MNTHINPAVIAERLSDAITAGHISQVYQPKVSAKTLDIVGVESLIRWKDPVHGFISPAVFIPIAEQYGLIESLTLKVMYDTIQQCSTWNKEGTMINAAINISVHDLHNPNTIQHYTSALQTFDVDPTQITFEITETAVMSDRDQCAAVLATLRAMGSGLSVDDFGTGHASFVYLKHFPITEVKIDKMFVDDIRSPIDRKIIKFTIELAHDLGCKVVAEGIEDLYTAQLLIEMGCDTLQGYHFGKPMTGTEISGLFHNQKVHV